VVQPIEQQMSGLDGLLYMSSESDKDGSITITLSFAQARIRYRAGTGAEQVAARAAAAAAGGTAAGCSGRKVSQEFLAGGCLRLDRPQYGAADIADFVASHLQDPVSRPLESETSSSSARSTPCAFGSTGKLDNYGLTSLDVANAVRAQNIQVASGELGGSRRSSGSS